MQIVVGVRCNESIKVASIPSPFQMMPLRPTALTGVPLPIFPQVSPSFYSFQFLFDFKRYFLFRFSFSSYIMRSVWTQGPPVAPLHCTAACESQLQLESYLAPASERRHGTFQKLISQWIRITFLCIFTHGEITTTKALSQIFSPPSQLHPPFSPTATATAARHPTNNKISLNLFSRKSSLRQIIFSVQQLIMWATSASPYRRD